MDELNVVCMLAGGDDETPRIWSAKAAARGLVARFMHAIKESDTKVFDRGAPRMQLFVLKKNGGEARWLSRAEAFAVTIDELLAPAGRFVRMDRTLQVDDDAHLGKSFTPSDGDVHVFVAQLTASDGALAAFREKMWRSVVNVSLCVKSGFEECCDPPEKILASGTGLVVD